MESRFDQLIHQIDKLELTTVHGRITEIVGMLIKAVVPQVKIGEMCLIKHDTMEPLLGHVVGFTKEQRYLPPQGTMA